MKKEQIDFKKYIVTFIITVAIFLTAFYLSEFFGNKKAENLRQVENNISLDILSSETQYDLLKEVSCEDVDKTILSAQINKLAERIESFETEGWAKDPQFVFLKKNYSLLQIKDYLLSKRLAEKCGKKTVFVIYIYGREDECPKCKDQAFVLDYLRKTYPDLRVYSFDYNLDLGAIKTLISIYKGGDSLPTLIINGKTFSGFKSKEEFISILPADLKTADELLEIKQKEEEMLKNSSSTTKATSSKNLINRLIQN
jgi:glutaredoxin